MNETFLDVRGKGALIEAVAKCWASLHGSRVVFYRRKKKIPEASVAMAVVVQVMVEPESAGVIFTVDPTKDDQGSLIIESAFGLGESVVGGTVSPDHFEVDKATLATTQVRISNKTEMVVRRAGGGTEVRALAGDAGRRPSLTPDRLRDLAKIALEIESHYGRPQDIEWAIAGGKIWIVQSRALVGVERGPGGRRERCASWRIHARGASCRRGKCWSPARPSPTGRP
jgi:pyruvate,water dikinase